MGEISISDFLTKMQMFGFQPGGGVTPGTEIAAINAGLGNTAWQQGVLNAVYVRDFRASSADLLPFVSGGDFVLPANTVLVVDTSVGTPESVLGRKLIAQGSLTLVASVPSPDRGIAQVTGQGTGTCMIEAAGGGIIFIDGVNIVSTDATRPVFAVSVAAVFSLGAFFISAIDPGTVNAEYIYIDARLLAFTGERMIIGAACKSLTALNFTTGSIGGSSLTKGFDLTTAPTSAPRKIYCSTAQASVDGATEGMFVIDTDNGDNEGNFDACLLETVAGTGAWIYAENDSPFNSEPAKSENFGMEVENFAITQRLGDIYFSGAFVRTCAVQSTFYDLDPVTGLGNCASGFSMTANGELQYDLETPSCIDAHCTVVAIPTSGGNVYTVGLFHKPAAGAYAQVSQGGANIQQSADPSGTVPTMNFGFDCSVNMSQGDRIKLMVRNDDGTNSFTCQYLSVMATPV